MNICILQAYLVLRFSIRVDLNVTCVFCEQLEEEESQGSVRLSKFLPLMTQVLLERRSGSFKTICGIFFVPRSVYRVYVFRIFSQSCSNLWQFCSVFANGFLPFTMSVLHEKRSLLLFLNFHNHFFNFPHFLPKRHPFWLCCCWYNEYNDNYDDDVWISGTSQRLRTSWWKHFRLLTQKDKAFLPRTNSASSWWKKVALLSSSS